MEHVPSNDEHLLELAVAIADGKQIEWADAVHGPSDSSSASSSSEPSIAALQVLERVVRGHVEVRALRARQTSRSDETLLTEARRLAAGPDADPLQVRWGPLEVREKIGHGSFGDVYRAWDPRLHREVALKLVRDSGGDALAPTVEEGRLLARVRHPNVVTVYGAERVGDRVGVWMEYVRGRTLTREVEEGGPLSAEAAARVGVEVCRALDAVHQAGVLHRDVKAQNVMRDSTGRIVLGDFGTGLEMEAGSASDSAVAGTPLYLAPEVLQGDKPSVASDLYSVGVLLYFLSSGQFPVRGRSVDDIRRAFRLGERVPLRQIKPGLPERFVSIVEALLDPGPDRRFGSAASAEAALSAWLADTSSAPAPAPRASGRARPLKMAAVGAAVLLAISAGWRVMRGDLAAILRSTPQWLIGMPLSRQILNPPCEGVPDDRGWIACVESILHLRERGGTPPPPLALFNLETGETRTLKSPRPQERFTGAAISLDGSRVAFSIATQGKPLEIRTMEVSGGAERTVFVLPNDIRSFSLAGWSAVDDRLEGRAWLANGAQAAILVAPASGALEKVFDFPHQAPQSFSRSPDGRHIAFDVRQSQSSSERDIQVCDVVSRNCATVVAHPANDFFPVWSSHRRLLFNSDRAGTMGLWAVDLDGLRAAASPELIRDTGRARISPLGFSRRGDFYYSLRVGDFDVFSAEMPDDDTQPVTPVRLSPRAVDMNRSPVWSPDGRWLAYMSQRGPFNEYGATRLVFQGTDGTEQAFQHEFRFFMSRLAWSPDGNMLAVRGLREGVPPQGVFGIHLIDRQTGRVVTTLKRTAPPERFVEDQIGDIAWIDSSSIVFSSQGGLGTLDVSTGEEQRLAAAGTGEQIQGMALSPDHTWVALNVSDDKQSWFAVRVAPVGGGTARELLRVTRPEVLWVQTWSADGRNILVTRWDGSLPLKTRRERLWRVPVDVGGSPAELPVAIAGLNEVRIHPDGRRIVFSAGAPQSEFWMMSGLGR
jgi:serine/threonine-protein kinase